MLKYGDGQADGKQSLGGSGEMIQFSAIEGPRPGRRPAGPRLAIRPARAARRELPDLLPHRGSEARSSTPRWPRTRCSSAARSEWVEVAFERPVELPRTFWVALDFRPHQTKGVYVSFDNSTGGRHSLVGLPGLPTARSRRGGDWMIEAVLAE